MKVLIEQFDAAARSIGFTRQNLDIAEIAAWCELHGWTLDGESGPLLARQALLNAVIRQSFPALALADTPFDCVSAPETLVGVVREAAQGSHAFNFWGELYSSLIPQSCRRRAGQFWTDECIAEWMVAWLLQFRPRSLVDVGCGAGNFLIKAAQGFLRGNGATALQGLDLSPLLLNVTKAAFATYHLPEPDLVAVNYLRSTLSADTDAIVCNPPYTRHHHISPQVKDSLQGLLSARYNSTISRKATMAFYFLMKLIAEMAEGAHCAIIVPMEVLDAHYGITAKRVLCQHTALSAIIHFSQTMNAFHKVDVGACILLFSKGCQRDNTVHLVTLKAMPTTKELMSSLEAPESQELAFGSLIVQTQSDLVNIPKWSSIAVPLPKISRWEASGLVVPLKALAKVVRGIATGANDFFALPTQEVRWRSLGPYVVRTIQRNREVRDIILDEEAWQALSVEGRRVWLLYLNGEDVNRDPTLSTYLAEGEARGYHRRSLVQTRKRWYLMERREVPAIFFTILTRGNPRFILNKAGVRPLNMFSLIYPRSYVAKADCTECLWALLNSTFSLSRLHSVSRTYGGNTLKVEPRELDNLPVINPLALPEETRRTIGSLIDGFLRHRDVSLFLGEIDTLISKLLSSEMTPEPNLLLTRQLQLLESQEGYEESLNRE